MILTIKHIWLAIADPAVERVVLIGHSQGGIIVSAWVDQLITDFSPTVLRKLEIYTFASAADHFSRAPPAMGPPDRHHKGDSLFGRVEHFANEGDFVAQYGVLNRDLRLHFFPSTVEDGITRTHGHFTGRIFTRDRDGHALLGH